MPTIIYRELRELLFSGKYAFLFIAAIVLVGLSLFNGVQSYEANLRDAKANLNRYQEALISRNSYERLWAPVERVPSALIILDPGLNGYVGRSGYADSQSVVPRISNSRYAMDPVLTLFGELSLTTTAGLILSLFAVLLSYSAISGEKESGTLKQMLANPVKRSTIIIGKIIGGLAPLALLLILPVLAGLLAIIGLTDIRFSGDEWLRIGGLLFASLFYLTLFYLIGFAASTLTQTSFMSFLVCLVIWLMSVAILPRAAVQVAERITPTMMQSEFLRKYSDLRWQYYQDQWSGAMNRLKDKRIKREEFNSVRQKTIKDWEKENLPRLNNALFGLFNEFRNKREALAATAISFSRVSPTSCLQFISHGLIGTGPGMLRDFEDAVSRFSGELAAYSERQVALHGAETPSWEKPRRPPFEAFAGPDGYVRVKINEREPEPGIDLPDMPEFTREEPPLSAAVADILPDLLILALEMIAAFFISFIAFQRYDVR